jgi:hypothetical protein
MTSLLSAQSNASAVSDLRWSNEEQSIAAARTCKGLREIRREIVMKSLNNVLSTGRSCAGHSSGQIIGSRAALKSVFARFRVTAVDVISVLVIEADAPKQAVSGFELKRIRVHWAKTGR